MAYPKIILSNSSHYAEEGQVNPLQWKTLLKTGENEFKDQSGWWICKDFLNDCVAFFREGYVFSIYGWKNNLKVNDEGVYHLLRNIADKEVFLKNLEVINKRLSEDLGCSVDVIPMQEKGQLIVLIPPACWETTYRISLITLLIRLSNYDTKFSSWGDFWKPNSVLKTDKNILGMPEAAKFIAEHGFTVPDEFKEYWYYCGEQSNSKITPKPTSVGIIHNCGIVSWVQWMNKYKNKKNTEKCVATAVTTS
jgi:hypothetical protein